VKDLGSDTQIHSAVIVNTVNVLFLALYDSEHTGCLQLVMN
jgi:hypothetical protein